MQIFTLIRQHLDDFLTELSESLRSGTYEPDPLLSFGIPKGTSGEVRTLHIPSIRDRVVERAVVNTIAHRADLAMSPCSFAYRTGIGTDDAVDHLARLRDAGYRYVLRTDIEDYFPNLNIEDALAALSPIAGCPRTIDLIRLIARPRRARGERRTRNRGIAQGSCLSPLLANLALTDVDRAMGDAGYGYARFADDIVICSPHEPDLLEALELLDSLLTPRGLRLNQEKTAMTSFDEGFCYLGTDFSRSFPPVNPRRDIKGRPDPDQVVYVGRDGTRVHISQNRLIVDGADGLPQTSMSSWGWRAPPQRPTSAACPGWSHRRSPSTGAAAAQGPGHAALSYAYAILLAECTGALWPTGSRPRSGCCTPPPTSIPASPWTSTRQARLATTLEGWGYRLQESVIQLRLEPAELDEVRRQVTEIINQADDVIHLNPLCDSCLAGSEVHGTAPALDDAGLYRGVW